MPVPSTTLQLDIETLCAVLLCGTLLAMGPHMARVAIPVIFFTLLVFGSAEAIGNRRMLRSNATAPAPSSGSACSVNTCDFYFEGYQNSVPIFQYAINPFSLFWLLTSDLLITVSKFGVNSHLLQNWESFGAAKIVAFYKKYVESLSATSERQIFHFIWHVDTD